MDNATIGALRAFPGLLADHYTAIPDGFKHWTPPSWDGIPSEHLTALEQLCHVRDIEVEGYHIRFSRTLNEESPVLASLDTDALATERNYGRQDAAAVLEAFRSARMETLRMLESVPADAWSRRAHFDGYGPVTLKGLVHYLCSHDQQHLAGLQWLAGQVACR
jgi:hypothetical protein